MTTLLACVSLACVSTVQGAEVQTLYGGTRPVYAVAFSPRGNVLAWPTNEHFVALHQLRPTHEVNAEQFQQLFQQLDSNRFDVRQRAFLSLAKMGRDVETHLRKSLPNAPSSEVRARIDMLLAALQPPIRDAHQGAVRTLAITNDGRTIVSAGKDRVVKLWSVAHGSVTKILRGHTESVWSAAVSPDDSLVATGSADNTIRLWDVTTGKALAVLRGHKSVVHGLSFSPSGKLLASAGSFDNSVGVWDIATRTRVAHLVHDNAPMCVAYSPGDRQLASGGYGGVVTVWDTSTWKQRMELTAGDDAVRSIAFATNGRSLVAGGDDHAVRIWNLSEGKLQQSFTDHEGAVQCVSLSPDGAILLSAGSDGKVRQRRIGPRGARAEVE